MNIRRRQKRKPHTGGFIGWDCRSLRVLVLLPVILFLFFQQGEARILIKDNTIIFFLDSPHREKNKQRIKKIAQFEKEIKYDKTKDPLVNKKQGFNPSAVDRLEGKKVAVSKDKKMAVLLSYSCTQMVYAAENPWKCDATATVLDAEGYVLNKNIIKGNFLFIQVHNSLPYFVLFCHTCCDGPRMGGLFDLNGEKLCDISDHRDDAWINHTGYRCIGDTPEKIVYIDLAARLTHDPARIHKSPEGKMIGPLPGKIDLPQDPVERLALLLYDRNSNVKMMAANALAKIGDKRALDILINALEDKNPKTRYSAVSALGNTKNHQIVNPIIRALKQENAPYVLTCGIRILGDFGDKKAAKLLIDLLSHKEATVRWEAADSLGKIKDPRSVNALIVSLKDTNQTVVTHAASALKRITNQDFGRDVNKWLKWCEENLE